MILDEHSGKIIEGIAVNVALKLKAEYPVTDYIYERACAIVTEVINKMIEQEKTT